jgi:hypothetical protein
MDWLKSERGAELNSTPREIPMPAGPQQAIRLVSLRLIRAIARRSGSDTANAVTTAELVYERTRLCEADAFLSC